MPEPLYDVVWNGRDDYLTDAGLEVIGKVIAKLPDDGFDLKSDNASQRSVTCTLAFPGVGPMAQLDALHAVLSVATVARTMHANLVAARGALAEGEGHRDG